MPVQINEVVIRTVIETPSASSGSGSVTNTPPPSAADTSLVEKVLEIIREKNER
ncbi:DUF5908 family protein [Chitinophaga sp. sic0106]|uniref:DUF5908 family protein n=1 Tax=Chitinophaga sp. sic0106 TaxID=2854785 RepID=UPI001C478AB0|nr:DUF5908 family protein [Chitinophaga sp. sic0106]MBV7530816.1 hypothetical protein [Chitinophaga sp. sic0106]